MKLNVRMALVGDYSAAVKAHSAIPRALEFAARDVSCQIHFDWLPTVSLELEAAPQLSTYDAVWCTPGSPYASMTGALNAIRFARESAVPFLGTCGGFQHVLIEYFRNVLGASEADHTESNPGASMPLISRLKCSLVSQSGIVRLTPGSRVASIYGRAETVENYFCNFGFNRRYRSFLKAGTLEVAGVDTEGEIRAVELRDHPFFVATLFQPELTALEGKRHPLIRAFTTAARSMPS
jgi:CTP synthase (UTP-ammonia lyase)